MKQFKSKQQVLQALAEQRKQTNPHNCMPKSMENRRNDDTLHPFKFISKKTTTSPGRRPLLRPITMKEWIFKDFRYDDKDQVFLNGIKNYEQPFAPIKFAPDFSYPVVLPKELDHMPDQVPSLIQEAKYSSDDLKLSSSSTEDVVKEFLNNHLI